MGRIERAIMAAVAAEPDNAFTVEDMCDRVYRGVNRVEKKHRVTVLRAMKKMASNGHDVGWLRARRLGGTLVLFNWNSRESYIVAHVKADDRSTYRNRDPRLWGKPTGEEEIRAEVRRRSSGGHGWESAKAIHDATRDRDTETVNRLEAQRDRELEAFSATLQALCQRLGTRRRRETKEERPRKRRTSASF